MVRGDGKEASWRDFPDPHHLSRFYLLFFVGFAPSTSQPSSAIPVRTEKFIRQI